ncbi:hypothetical protein [Corynebacterium halotolerans]|uniref:Uncharacterized protein n=1 Tax=Corynebacterium halotolerans YIM 70093 = DSM 44683 TaxID=1121362 RepID=M1P8S5_9CORY|nr:hypothetical protein [Corynebacterium halotolerans]AGF73066.1 hypothetical protein A605_10330 [Corynebacterium halotolerans YIM 70093 = DSM 44683]
MLKIKTRNPILITSPMRSRFDLYKALGCILNPKGFPAPNCLDEMADLLRDNGVDRVVCADWQLVYDDEVAILDVFRDLGVTLQR